MLAQQPVDLVVSDMRMPVMDGARLLQAVRQGWPDVGRLLLTGYADIGSTMAAINEGEIQRYIAKPWDDKELVQAVQEGMARSRRLKQDREHLALTQAQNEQLERRVAARTAELSQVNAMLERAFADLRENFMLSIKVFAGLMELRDGGRAGHSERVGQLARRLAVALQLSEPECEECYAAGLLHEVGKLALPDGLLRQPVSTLRGDDLAQYRRYPLHGETALMPLTGLRGVARLVRSHQERLNGNGFPDGLAGEEVPLAAQIVGLAVTFEGLRTGRLSEQCHGPDQARALIRGAAGTHFALPLVQAFEALMAAAPPPPPAQATRDIGAAELLPGMVLAQDLLSPRGTLLLAAGYAFDAPAIATIQDLVVREGLGIAFRIRNVPSAAPGARA
ncbi:two-component system response regulator [Pelomonas sp. HMWF004]|nr:two-component system response regulator [Pelomonas sp. HMWF004]